MESRTIVLVVCTAAVLGAAVIIATAPVPVAPSPGPVTSVTPAPAASLRPDTPGTLAVTSVPPGAEIWLDTDPGPSGTTPARFTLSPITHPVMVRLAGYRDHVTSVAIRPGQNATLDVTLVPEH
jgi:hypothetical protein